MNGQGSPVEERALRQDLEDREPKKGRLQRHHRHPPRLQAEVRICAGEQDAYGETDRNRSKLSKGKRQLEGGFEPAQRTYGEFRLFFRVDHILSTSTARDQPIKGSATCHVPPRFAGRTAVLAMVQDSVTSYCDYLRACSQRGKCVRWASCGFRGGGGGGLGGAQA